MYIIICRFFDNKAGLWGDSQSNPVLSFPDNLLEEEPVAMNTGADEEEGAITDPGNEVLEEADEKVKVYPLNSHSA